MPIFEVCGFHKEFNNNDPKASKTLQLWLDEIIQSKLDSPNWSWGFRLKEVDLTPPILALLLQFLNHPLPPRADLRRGLKLNFALFEHCRILQPLRIHETVQDNKRFCTPKDLSGLIATVIRRSSHLGLSQSPDLLPFLFSGPTIDINFLEIDQIQLSAIHCAGLADWVQRNVRVTNVNVNTSYLESPRVVAEGLSKALHLKSLVFERKSFGTDPSCYPALLREGGNDNSLIEQLLSPQSRLRELRLSHIRMQDCHFLAIVQMLPKSQLEHLDVTQNKIQWKAVIAFARQLSKIKYLKEVNIGENPWEGAREGTACHYDMCCTALMDGMLQNYSIERMSIVCRTAAGKMVRSCYRTNRYRERVLATCHSIPVGVWPWILEGIGLLDCQCHPMWAHQSRFQKHRANALYCVLTHSSVLAYICHSYPIE